MFEEIASSTAELLLIAFLIIIFLFMHAIELKYFWELAKGKDPELQRARRDDHSDVPEA